MNTYIQAEKLHTYVSNELDVPDHLQESVDKIMTYIAAHAAEGECVEVDKTDFDQFSFELELSTSLYLGVVRSCFVARVADTDGENKVQLENSDIAVEDFLAKVDVLMGLI